MLKTKAAAIELPTLRGASLAMFHDATTPEIILSGPAGTGKSFACLWKLHYAASKYPGARCLIIRKTRESITESALVTFESQVLPPEMIGNQDRASRRVYPYENGSEVIVAGLTQSRIDQRAKVMSTEYDLIYVQEAIETSQDDWEKLTTRLRNGKVPYQQIIGDTNPDSPMHWIWSRGQSGRTALLNSEHKDNPRLWDGSNWTRYGAEYLERLDRLTGVMRSRFRDGQWVQASGLIYGDVWSDGPDNGNVTEAAEYIPNNGYIAWAVDDGYSAGSMADTRGIDLITGHYVADAHPRVILFCQIRDNGQIVIFDESYACLKLSNVHIAEAKEYPYPEPDLAVHGPGAAEIRGRFHEAGITPRQSTAKVDESIKEMRAALAADENGFRRVIVHPRCKHFRAEMSAYVYEQGTETPVKQYDHGPDSIRGLCHVLRFER
jgi:phage terminase large subunit